MTRTLPNTFALVFCTLVFHYWIKQDYVKATSCLAFAGVVFRCDLVLLAVPVNDSQMGGWLLLKTSRKDLFDSVFYGCLAALAGVVMSVCVDSYFWRVTTWPELEVLLFNTVENRSSEWGVSPWHWYFTSALPRVLLSQTLLFGAGLFMQKTRKSWVDKRLLPVLFLVIGFTVLYSFLPHKELRFLLPILPGVNIVTAIGLAKM